MSEERRRVLEMLQEGKITSEDALRILEALGEEEKTIPASEEPKLQPPAEAKDRCAGGNAGSADYCCCGSKAGRFG